MIEIGPRDRVLHLGFGDGTATMDFARRAAGGLALGIDPSDDRVRVARKLAVEVENVMFVVGSHEEVPWQGNFFSVVVSDAPAADWTCAAREMFRVAASGARVYVKDAPSGAEAVFEGAGFGEVRRDELLLIARKQP
jgi:ubiquinone/menaquinone biosynthesis C-methylase UbiE